MLKLTDKDAKAPGMTDTNEQSDARYLRSCLANGQATEIMDMVREMDEIVKLLGIADSFEKPTDVIRRLMQPII